MKEDNLNYWKIRYRLEKENPIHFIKRFLVKKEIGKIIKDKKLESIADIGCGLGILAKELKDSAVQIYGYDLDKEIIKATKFFSRNSNINYSPKSLEKIETKKPFNIVIMTEVLDYIPDDMGALIKVNSLLENNGYLVLTVPINKNFNSEFEKREHRVRYKPEELIRNVKNAGFTIITKRFWGYPLNNYFYKKVIIPASNKKADSKNKYPTYTRLVIMFLSFVKYIFLFDLLFNDKRSFDILLVAQKVKVIINEK